MRIGISIVWLASLLGTLDAVSADLLRFTNGDQLHGTFQGIKPGPQIVWQREDLAGDVEFKSTQIRHLIFNGGKSTKSLASLSHLACVNGDRLPGTITGIDSQFITLDTPYAGVLKLPRRQVAMIAPSPLGGRIFYHGPFIENEWKMAHASFPDGLPAPQVKPPEDDREPPSPERWVFSGSSWVWPHKSSGTALLHRNGMPDRAILRFDLAWKNRLSLAVAFQADFAPPKEEKGAKQKDKQPIRFAPGDSSALPLQFGNSYVMHVFSNHIMLYRTAVNGDGVASLERIQVNSNNLRLGDSGKTTMEIRSNRVTGRISLFIDDEFAAQWSELVSPENQTTEQPNSRGFGFVVQAENSSVRISDIIVAEWNGMPDSARSLQVDDQDIVLLANGTDRFSGDVKSLEDGKIRLAGKFGEFTFPLAEVAEVRFAKKRLEEPAEQAAGETIVRFSPIGHMTGKILSSDHSGLRLLTPLLGELSCSLESAIMLDFQPSNNPIDDWNSEF